MRRFVRNAVSLLASGVVSRATVFILYTLVARFLGAQEFGQLSLALTLSYTFQVFAIAGLKTLVTREVARDRSKTDSYFVNASLTVLATSLLSIAILALFVRAMNYSAGTAAVILTLAFGLVPIALSAISEAIFQAWERMEFIALANLPVNITQVGLVYLLLKHNYALQFILLVLLGSFVAITLLEWGLMLLYISRPRPVVDARFSLSMARSTTTFLGIDAVVAVTSTLTLVLLSKLATEKDVGYFNAATQFLVPMTLFAQNVVSTAFPVMCRQLDPAFQGLRNISERLIAVLLAAALPAVAGAFLLAEPALVLLYGRPDFAAAANVLRVMIVTLLFTAFTAVLGQSFIASHREHVPLRIVVVDALVGLLLCVALIGRFGLMGAALAMLLTRLADFVLHYAAAFRQFGSLNLKRLGANPVLATAGMAAYVEAARDVPVILLIASAALVYVAILAGLTVWSSGGLREFRARYRYIWTE